VRLSLSYGSRLSRPPDVGLGNSALAFDVMSATLTTHFGTQRVSHIVLFIVSTLSGKMWFNPWRGIFVRLALDFASLFIGALS